MKTLSVVVLALLLSGCSGLSLLSMLKPSTPAIQAEVVIGDKNEEVSVGGQEAEVINNNNEAPMWLVAFACAGWFLPSPRQCMLMVKEYRTDG